MRKLILLLLILSCGFVRADLVTSFVTITNTAGTTNGQSITINGIVRVFSNSVPNFLFIANGTNISSTATNVYLSYSGPQTKQTGITIYALTTTNTLVFQAPTLTITLSAGIGTVSNYTQFGTNIYNVQVPYTAFGSTEQQVMYSGAIAGINNAATNVIALNRLTNTVVDTLSTQTISGLKTFSGGATVSTILSVPSTANTSTIQNLSVSNLTLQSHGKFVGVITNGSVAYNLISYSPILSNTPVLYNPNVSGGNFTNSTNYGIFYATNFSSVDSFDQYIDLGDGTREISFIDNDGTGFYFYSGGGDVNINAQSLNVTNGTGGGTILADRFELKSVMYNTTNNTSLANGNNADVATGLGVIVAVSGPTAAFTINGMAGGVDGRYVILRNSTG
jgi:hypothetical protein